MFRKLKWKLVFLNVSVAGLILIAMSAAAFLFLMQIIKNQSEQMISLMSGDIIRQSNGGFRSPIDTLRRVGSYNPFFVLHLDETGQVLMMNYNTDLTEQQMSELAAKALERESEAIQSLETTPGTDNRMFIARRVRSSSVLALSGGRYFRYSIVGPPMGSDIYMIFLDMQQERAMLLSVGLTLLGCVLAGLLLTLLGGLFLAERSLRPVKASWQKQRDFVADASHELRSPLAAIRCNLDVVLDEPSALPADKQLYMQGITEETDRMTTLVDELLLLARADSDTVVLLQEQVQLSEQARAAVSLMQPLAAKKAIKMSLDDAECPAVQGDGARLRQVIIALLDNAIKYTPPCGEVSVTVKKARDRAVLEVRDSGIGIAPEHRQKIFERFYRVDKARARESGGNGLGLSIAQWIVQQHGGTIGVESREGEGSAFLISLPLAAEKKQSKAAQKSQD